MHRALADLDSGWKLLKWLDEPADFYDWRGASQWGCIPTMRAHMDRMTKEFATGTTVAGGCAWRTVDGEWAPVHMTINRIELEPEDVSPA